MRHLLDARGFVYDLVLVETEQELLPLSQRSGRMSCPLVYVGSELIGGLEETIAAERSGQRAALAGSQSQPFEPPRRQEDPPARRPAADRPRSKADLNRLRDLHQETLLADHQIS